MSTWRYCEGLLVNGSVLHVVHLRRADKTGLCNWCRKRIREDPEKWRRIVIRREKGAGVT